MRKTILFYAVATIIISGCVAKMEKMPGGLENSKYAPTNSAEQYGVISYYEAHGQSAREDAYKKMYDTCNGSYKIVGEEIGGSSTTAIVPIAGGGAIASNSAKVYIKFVCN